MLDKARVSYPRMWALLVVVTCCLGPEVLEFGQHAVLLILNGRTPGDEYGQFTV